jgi:hypothetical protein
VTFTRSSPSPRYRELLNQYRQLHEEGERHLGIPPAQTFDGRSLLPHIGRIKKLVQRTAARTLLDYGCGKGTQYEQQLEDAEGRRYGSVAEFWGVTQVHRYDPGFAPFSTLPESAFDAVICTDVLEHCPEEDMPWIIGELFHYARSFVYANVACYPAQKRLPSGENAHCTVQPAAWWAGIFEGYAAERPGLIWEVWVQRLEQTPAGARLVEERLGN